MASHSEPGQASDCVKHPLIHLGTGQPECHAADDDYDQNKTLFFYSFISRLLVCWTWASPGGSAGKGIATVILPVSRDVKGDISISNLLRVEERRGSCSSKTS